ncbi:MAG: YhfC family intramembrane metalloprotease [Chloroflexi bacterium]|nr:YhfC family intramembrane metalloprotease [Chloroflexota bacterium]MBI3167236.1 YhfC family intramembrane metalloprotease [Chloroflexota bacterium]
MLETMLVINFVGMIVIPVIAGVYITRKLNLSWKLFLAGGLTFIASQVLHIPLVLALTPTFQSWGVIAYALILGLLAGLFEETARYILFKFVLKKSRTWNEGVYVGIGHGGTEAIIFGVITALTFVNMLAYRYIDLSTVPNIPPEQLELAKQQVEAYWFTPPSLALLGVVERIFAMCLHVALSVMVMHGLVSKKQIWFWLAVLWHALADAGAVYLGQNISMLAVEGVIGVFAIFSIVIVLWIKPKFAAWNVTTESQLDG